MMGFRFLAAGLCLTATTVAAQASVTAQFIYVKTSTSGPDVFDTYLRVLESGTPSAGLASYNILARYSSNPANAALNDAATWSQNNLKATQGSETAGFWRAGDDQQRPGVVAIDEPGVGYDFNVVNTQFDSEIPVANIGKAAVSVTATSGPSINLTAVPYLGTITLPAAAAGTRTITSDANLFAPGGLGATRVIVDVNDLVIQQVFTIPGDADVDGDVDFTDFLILQGNFASSGSIVNGDFNHSGFVDFSDFLILQGNFGLLSPAEEAHVASFVASVPEPGSLVALCLISLTALCRRF